jgi:rRNA-processing protein FCF1
LLKTKLNKANLDEKYMLSKQISELQELVDKINNDTELNEYLLDFFETMNNNNSIDLYEENLNKGQMDSFYTSRINNSKISTYNEYIQKFNPELREISNSSTPKKYNCSHCGSDSNKTIYDYKTSCELCTECGSTEHVILMNEGVPVYSENTEQVILFNYDRKNHFQECLNQLQAKENTTIPPQIIKELSMEFKKYNITKPEQFTNSLVQSYLKKLKYNKYYEHIPTIINEFCGLKAPKLTPELEQQLKIMFDEIQIPFEKYSKQICPLRKNFLNYNYTFFKMCQLLGKDEFLSYFPLLKNRERLYEHDQIWRGICNDLRWEFIPSI